MPLFYVQDDKFPKHVWASDWANALTIWRETVAEENKMDPGDVEEPQGIQYIASDEELMLFGNLVRMNDHLDSLRKDSVESVPLNKRKEEF